MAAPFMSRKTSSSPEFHDMQGLIASAYSHLPCAAYLLLRVSNRPSSGAWLNDWATRITTASAKQARFSLNIAFTASGLATLGLPADALETFSFPFLEGMVDQRRSRILGDFDNSDPQYWHWGGPLNERVDMILLAYAIDDDELATRLNEIRESVAHSGGITEVLQLDASRQSDNREHFGFADGIGQPTIGGGGPFAHQHEKQLERTSHATLLKPGEFILGYADESGQVANLPTLAWADDLSRALPPVPEPSGRTALGSNGSYLVFRQMAQHVAEFWNCFENAARLPNGRSDAAERELLAAKAIGRWKSGAPLVLAPDNDNPALHDRNDFAYTCDNHGLKCPIGAHIRRANPRDSLDHDHPDAALHSVRRHRLLRRARSYGKRADDPFVDDGKARGLHFICLVADLERQFEFVQQTWIHNPAFAGLNRETDPLIGARVAPAHFTAPATPVRRRVHGLSHFITVRGGAYFFLPGLRALRCLAGIAVANRERL